MRPWPDPALRGALLLTGEDVLRVGSGATDPVIRRECAAVLSMLDRCLEVLPAPADEDDENSQPLGSVLVVSAPECSAQVVVQQVLAALITGNRVAVAYHHTLGHVARIVLVSLQRCAPSGVLKQFDDEAFRLDWAQVRIVVLTPTRVFMNDEPWVSCALDPNSAELPSDVVELYRARHAIAVS